MKKIIRGIRFDTDKAEAIARATCGIGDYAWVEILYRTAQGRWFVWGNGGSMSRWAKPGDPGRRVEGEGVQSLTGAEADMWLEQHGFLAYEAPS